MTHRIASSILLLALSGCSAGEPILECEDEGNAHAICGFQNPEDLALLSDDRTVVVSQYGSMTEDVPGNLALFDLESETLRVVFPDPDARGARPSAPLPGWGDPQCPGPPGDDFNPHGIDLAERPDGSYQILVVNQGGRESVELFEVSRREGSWAVDWRGCAIPPEEAFFNDVVGLPDGGFLASHMMPRGSPIWGNLRASFGADTGSVYEWLPGRGYRSVPGTEAPFPNGIEISQDASEIYLNLYATGEVRRYDRATGKRLASAEVSSPDNVTWSRDGRLLVASHLGGLRDQILCLTLSEGTCPMEFAIVALDPLDLTGEVLYHNEGPPMGGGTVAIDLGPDLLIGTFAGDRVIRVAR
jgi:hypothetical protein